MQFKHKISVWATDEGVPKAKLISLVLFSILISSVEDEQEIYMIKVEIIQKISIIKITKGMIYFKNTVFTQTTFYQMQNV